jgi:hypothetical protein
VLKFILKNDPLFIFITPVLIIIAVLMMLLLGSGESAQMASSRIEETLLLPYWLKVLLSGLLALISGFLFNQFVQVLGMLKRISNLPLLMFGLLCWSIPVEAQSWSLWTVVLLETLLFLWIIRIIEEPDRLRVHVFNIGMIIGIMALVDAWGIFFLLVTVLALAQSARRSLRLVLIMIIGYLLPIYFLNGVLFMLGAELIFPLPDLDFVLLSLSYTKNEVLALGMTVIVVLSSLFLLTMIGQSSTLREKKMWRMVMLLALGAAVMMFSQGYYAAVYYLILPFAAMLAKIFLNVKSQKLGNALMVLLIALIILVNT